MAARIPNLAILTCLIVAGSWSCNSNRKRRTPRPFHDDPRAKPVRTAPGVSTRDRSSSRLPDAVIRAVLWLKGTQIHYHGHGRFAAGRGKDFTPEEAMRMRSLNLMDQSTLSDADLEYVAAFTHLESLLLRSTRLTDEGLSHLTSLAHLQGLSVTGRGITDRGMIHVAALKNLRELYLSWNDNIKGPGLVHLSQLPRLRMLDLRGTKIHDGALAHLKPLSELETLVLSDTPVTDAGLKHLEGLRRLSDLDLALTGVTDKGLAVLGRVKTLQHLKLTTTGISERAVRKLKQALPGCIVRYGRKTY